MGRRCPAGGDNDRLQNYQFLKVAPPEMAAAFQFMARVPGEPDRVQYRVTVEGEIPFEIVGLKKK